jgi:hypothetical protein
MMVYQVMVSQTKYPEYPCFSFYDVESWAEHVATREAKERFQDDRGFKPEFTKVKILNKD